MGAQHTPKRGPKAPPKSQPVPYTKPVRNASHTKSGPGRRAHRSADADAPRKAVAPQPEKKLRANVGRDFFDERRVWKDGEPVHVVKPVRAHRAAIARATGAAE